MTLALSSSAMCTAASSPHSPSKVHSPAASRWIAVRQPSSPTITRGHGRCCVAFSVCAILSTKATALSQELGDVLEADDERRRQVNARDEHDGEVREHRHIGRVNGPGRTTWLAECDAAQPQKKATERNKDAEDECGRKPWLAREGGR